MKKELVAVLAAAAAFGACRGAAPRVVAYASEDQVFSEPILRDFERDTGIEVRAVFDTEEAKSTGVVNRLLAEKENPQADVYWANEPIRAEMLRQRGVAATYFSPQAAGIPAKYKDPAGYWTGFSARARVFVVHSSMGTDRPSSVRDYASPRFRGRGTIANPLFGSTTAYVAALFAVWGDDPARQFLDAAKSSGVRIATSNGESADLVASGESGFALVDSDDASARLARGKPIALVYPDQGPSEPGCMIIPNALVLVRGGPNPESGKRLIDYLLSPETERKLAFSEAAQIPLHPGVATPAGLRSIESLRTMDVDYARVAAKMQEIQPLLRTWVGY